MFTKLKQIIQSLIGSNTNKVSSQDLNEMIKNGDPLTIIDVRSKDEFRQGHIPGAKVIPLDQITKKLDKIPKSHPVVFTCLSGTRSRMAAGQVANMGFENIYNHQGGFRAWQQAGLPVKR